MLCLFILSRYVAPRARSASSGQGENEHRIMALFFFLLFVSGFYDQVCVFFFKAYPGAAALGHPIPLLSFAADLTSRAAPSCSGSSDERSSH